MSSRPEKSLIKTLLQSSDKMLDLIPDLISIQDSDMKIIYSNWKGFGAGAEAKRLPGTKCYRTYRGFDQICPDCRAVEVFKTKMPFQQEVRLQDDTLLDQRVIPILNQNNEVKYIIEWVRDITAQRETEEALARQNRLLEGIFNAIPDVLAIQHPDYRVERYNQAGYNLLGLSPEQVKNRKCYELIGRDRQCEKCATSKALQTRQMERVEIYVPELDLYLDCRSNPVLDQNGNVRYIIEQLRDVTDQKKQEQDLRKSEEKYRLLSENVSDIVWTCDMNLTYTYISPSVKKMLGFSPGELTGENISTTLTPESLDKAVKLFQEEISLEQTKIGSLNRVRELEIEHFCKDGSKIWTEIKMHFLYNQQGEPTGIFGISRDITERKAAEKIAHERFTFETLISNLSSFFISLPPENLDRGIDYALQATGTFFAVDRSYLFHFSEDGELMSNTHEWCAAGITPQKDNNQDHLLKALPWWAEKIKHDDYVHIPAVNNLPVEAAKEKRVFQDQDIKSLLCIPIRKNGLLFGFLGFDAVKEKKVWLDNQITLLNVVAELISNALIRHQSEQQIRRLSFFDQLTGLYNRHYFVNELKRLEKSRNYPIAVISADLDGLKLVNDTIGHHEGDLYLQRSATFLKESLRSADILARVGGDEFVLILPQTNRKDGEALLKRMESRLAEYNNNSSGLPLSISLGLAVNENGSQSLEETYQAADDLMYKNKLKHSSNAKENIIRFLLATLYERDRYLRADNDKLQELCLRLGRKISGDEKMISNLLLLAQVRELGMVTIPEPLFNKPADQLSEPEKERIRQHTERGYRLAQASPELSEIAALILSHHENWDGSGYPSGLKGKDIPVECRILAIVEAYLDLMQGVNGQEGNIGTEIKARLKAQAGTRLDPELLEHFFEAL